jgi:hypothetical protein
MSAVGAGIAGAAIAFFSAAVAVGTDAQNEMKARLGTMHGTSVPLTRAGIAFIAFWGAVDVACYLLFLHNHEWAKRAFQIDVEENLLWTGLIVGLSAVLIFRTNLATVGSFQVGGELAYTFTRSILVDRLNRRRTRMRRAFVSKASTYFNDLSGYPRFFTSLEATLLSLSAGSLQKAVIEDQLKRLRGATDAPNGDVAARESITGLIYDYFGPKEFDDWVKDSQAGNK